jgi:hypothetical protein
MIRVQFFKHGLIAAAAGALAFAGAPVLYNGGTSGNAVAQQQNDQESGNRGSGGDRGGRKQQGQSGAGAGQGQGEGRGSDRVYRGGKDVTDQAQGQRGGPPTDRGSGRGDAFADLYVMQRNEDGTIVTETEDGVTYVFILNESGEWVKVPLDENGHFEVPEDIAETLVEAELVRLNMGRSPRLLDLRYDEVLSVLNSATSISTDETGRLVVTYEEDGQTITRTIDSPAENMALYVMLITNGYLPGLTVSSSVLSADLQSLLDQNRTSGDLAVSAALLAAASDKYTELGPDAIVYINRILSIATDASSIPTLQDVTGYYVDFDTYATNYTYDRTVFDVTVELAFSENGSVVIREVNLKDYLDTTFGTLDGTLDGFEAFSTAAEDTRAVIGYIHDHQIPAE